MTTREFLKKLTPSPVTALLIGLIVYLWFRPPAFVDYMARPAPDIPELTALKGKVVLVNFWATWCPYCRHEMPAMEAFYQAHRDKGFEIVAYSLDKSQAEVNAYMREEGYTFTTTLIDQTVSKAFDGVNRVPLSFVIDRNGVIRHRIAGQLHAGRLDTLITPLLATPSGSGSR